MPKATACTAVVSHEHHPLLRSVLHPADTGMRAQPMRGVHNVLPPPTHATP
ncbi:conserved hypothetical protein [Xanthomonas citri pv. fuscans]|uniref:Uncharacterized protein n=1 Tax=Xanthomonas campestris pv. phaseoli TaxID=317013 RepID=A0A7Z7J2U6_XANCH|nr:conserved hypothetical protein [Xanthomonas citri pv. fuscans]SOO26305.1 conserved hypothetical protein [Xanthomonas phaseoli pv. phaseoli]